MKFLPFKNSIVWMPKHYRSIRFIFVYFIAVQCQGLIQGIAPGSGAQGFQVKLGEMNVVVAGLANSKELKEKCEKHLNSLFSTYKIKVSW